MSDEYWPSDAVMALAVNDRAWRWEYMTHGMDDPYITVTAPNGQRFIAIMEYDEGDL